MYHLGESEPSDENAQQQEYDAGDCERGRRAHCGRGGDRPTNAKSALAVGPDEKSGYRALGGRSRAFWTATAPHQVRTHWRASGRGQQNSFGSLGPGRRVHETITGLRYKSCGHCVHRRHQPGYNIIIYPCVSVLRPRFHDSADSLTVAANRFFGLHDVFKDSQLLRYNMYLKNKKTTTIAWNTVLDTVDGHMVLLLLLYT